MVIFARQAFTPPHAGQRGPDFLLEAGDQFAVGVDQRLLGFDFGDDGLLGGEGWEGDFEFPKATLNKSSISMVTGFAAKRSWA